MDFAKYMFVGSSLAYSCVYFYPRCLQDTSQLTIACQLQGRRPAVVYSVVKSKINMGDQTVNSYFQYLLWPNGAFGLCIILQH